MQPRVNKGLGSLAVLEQQCFRHDFQGTLTKMSLLDSLVRLTALYSFTIWGHSLLESDWASMERIHFRMLQCILRCRRFTPHNVILAEFGAHPFGWGPSLIWLGLFISYRASLTLQRVVTYILT